MEFVPKEELVLDPLPEGPVNEAAKVGERIRALRADRFSLEALASKAGISAGMLSQVENGRGNPTFRMLYRVAGALGVEVEQLLEPSPRRPTSIVRRTDPMRTRTARGFRISAMTPAADRGLAVCTVHLTPGAEHDVLGDYDGDFCVWVRTGTLTIKSPDGQVKDHEITREKIHVASIKGWKHKPAGGWDYTVDADSKIAYMRLTNFTKDSSNELNRAIDQIKTTGLLQFPLRILAWEGISVVEIITTLHEMMIIIQAFDVDRAFTSIRQGLEVAKRRGPGQPSNNSD